MCISPSHNLTMPVCGGMDGWTMVCLCALQDNSSSLHYQHFLLWDKAATVHTSIDTHRHADGRWPAANKAKRLCRGKVASWNPQTEWKKSQHGNSSLFRESLNQACSWNSTSQPGWWLFWAILSFCKKNSGCILNNTFFTMNYGINERNWKVWSKYAVYCLTLNQSI